MGLQGRAIGQPDAMAGQPRLHLYDLLHEDLQIIVLGVLVEMLREFATAEGAQARIVFDDILQNHLPTGHRLLD